MQTQLSFKSLNGRCAYNVIIKTIPSVLNRSIHHFCSRHLPYCTIKISELRLRTICQLMVMWTKFTIPSTAVAVKLSYAPIYQQCCIYQHLAETDRPCFFKVLINSNHVLNRQWMNFYFITILNRVIHRVQAC